MDTEWLSSRDGDIPVFEKAGKCCEELCQWKISYFSSTGEGMNVFYMLPFLWCLTSGDGAMEIEWRSLSRPSFFPVPF